MLSLNAPPLLDLAESNEIAAVARTAGLLEGRPEVIDFSCFVDAVMDRQAIHPPLLSNGVAVPHARTKWVREIVCVAARCVTAVPFGAEQFPVRLIFLFGIPPHRISEYLAVMAALVKRLRQPDVLEGLLNAENAAEFMHWLT